MLHEERVSEIRQRLEAATAGPWEGDALEGYIVARSGDVATVTMWSDADADLMINAPADLADLLAEVERLAAVVEEVAENAWDEGNCCGLDGWIGPGRGEPVDDEAMHARGRDVAKILKNVEREGDQ